MKSPRRSSRTFSPVFPVGWLGLAAMPSRLPSTEGATKVGPLPSGEVLAFAFFGTTSPSDSRSTPRPFAFGLWARSSPDVGRRDGSLLFRVELSPRVLLPTPGESCSPPAEDDSTPSLAGAVCCLRRDMIGSASPPFRAPMSRGCKVHAAHLDRIGPAALLPPAESYDSVEA